MSRYARLAADPNALAAGESTVPRLSATSATVSLTSGSMRLAFFTAAKTEAVGNLRVITSATAAGATPTLCRIGLFEVAANGDLTLATATANDTALFAAANTAYTRAVTSSYTKLAGQRYAAGILIVTAAATPTLMGMGGAASAWANEALLAPTVTAQRTGLADLPSTATAGSLTTSGAMPYVAVTP